MCTHRDGRDHPRLRTLGQIGMDALLRPFVGRVLGTFPEAPLPPSADAMSAGSTRGLLARKAVLAFKIRINNPPVREGVVVKSNSLEPPLMTRDGVPCFARPSLQARRLSPGCVTVLRGFLTGSAPAVGSVDGKAGDEMLQPLPGPSRSRCEVRLPIFAARPRREQRECHVSWLQVKPSTAYFAWVVGDHLPDLLGSTNAVVSISHAESQTGATDDAMALGKSVPSTAAAPAGQTTYAETEQVPETGAVDASVKSLVVCLGDIDLRGALPHSFVNSVVSPRPWGQDAKEGSRWIKCGL